MSGPNDFDIIVVGAGQTVCIRKQPARNNRTVGVKGLGAQIDVASASQDQCRAIGGDVRAGAFEPPERILAIPRVLCHPGDRARMERLQIERA